MLGVSSVDRYVVFQQYITSKCFIGVGKFFAWPINRCNGFVKTFHVSLIRVNSNFFSFGSQSLILNLSNSPQTLPPLKTTLVASSAAPTNSEKAQVYKRNHLCLVLCQFEKYCDTGIKSLIKILDCQSRFSRFS